MNTLASLQGLFRYQSWAHGELIEKLEGLDPESHAREREDALRLLNHVLIVNRIFMAHLMRQPHGCAADNTPDTPTLDALKKDIQASDGWYLDYLGQLAPEALATPWSFVFTDGDAGSMTREEMLMHVLVHATYHRGEVGRILRLAGAPLPWDTFAVYLHGSEPGRRRAPAASPALTPA